MKDGHSFANPLLRVVWDISKTPLPFPAQVAISVSKKSFRLAVTRNLIKRRMREAYRKNKNSLYDHLSSKNISLVLLIIVKGQTVPDYDSVERSVTDILRKLILLTSPREPKS